MPTSDDGSDAADACHVSDHSGKPVVVHQLEGRAAPLEGTGFAQFLQRLVGMHRREADGIRQVLLRQRQRQSIAAHDAELPRALPALTS